MTPDTERSRRPFSLSDAAAILSRTPATFDAILRHLPPAWATAHEGGASWSPIEIVGHLIDADGTNWMPRLITILEQGERRPFDEFQRSAFAGAIAGRTLADLLDEFARVRSVSLERLAALGLHEADLDRRGRHPSLGVVTLRQLLSAWVVHDLDHIVQAARVLATQYSDEAGPWRAYLRVIREPVPIG